MKTITKHFKVTKEQDKVIAEVLNDPTYSNGWYQHEEHGGTLFMLDTPTGGTEVVLIIVETDGELRFEELTENGWEEVEND